MEIVVVLSDWYHGQGDDLYAQFNRAEAEGEEPEPSSCLINGIGQFKCHGNACSYSKFRVPTNRRIRLRLINQSVFGAFYFSIDGHVLTIIEADGTDVKQSAALDFVQINVGERYSFLVTKKSDGPDSQATSFWMRATLDNDLFAKDSENSQVLAWWYYGDNEQMPNTLGYEFYERTVGLTSEYECSREEPNCTLISPIDLNPYPEEAMPLVANRTFQFSIDFYAEGRDQPIIPHFNNVSFQKREISVTLLNMIRAGIPTSEAEPFSTSSIEVYDGEVIDLLFNNHDTGQHPIHLHGYKFWILGYGLPKSGNYNENFKLDFENPIKRDVATVRDESWLYLRFRANNPGVWLLHCHINWHSVAGMDLIVVQGPEKIREILGSTSNLEMCTGASSSSYQSNLFVCGLSILFFFFHGFGGLVLSDGII
eukprot:TRINITY_DN8057_c0_g1_i10.p1 TRINITY_DN8057_c0_g1~~TRINITY_DN8057_c0_g1_i10.p1  ORF type:complete len:451 (-),score=58.52 TRINITY_DN8057_c0_g1_i10:87-1361(-)